MPQNDRIPCHSYAEFILSFHSGQALSAAKGSKVNSAKDLADKQCCIYNGIVNTGDNDKNEK